MKPPRWCAPIAKPWAVRRANANRRSPSPPSPARRHRKRVWLHGNACIRRCLPVSIFVMCIDRLSPLSLFGRGVGGEGGKSEKQYPSPPTPLPQGARGESHPNPSPKGRGEKDTLTP